MAKTRTSKGRSVKRSNRARKYISARKAIRKARKANFVRAVKQVISAQTESKHAHITSGNNLVFFNSGINSTGDMLQIIPNIAQGTADNQRIGDQIRGQKLTVSGYVRLGLNSEDVENRATTNVLCRMMIVSLKPRNGYYQDAANSAFLSLLLKKGGTTSAFEGRLGDINAEINREVFTVHSDRKFYLTQDMIAQPATAGLASVAVNTRNIIKFFKINVPCKKLLRYDSGLASGLQPTNFAPMLLLGYAALDGSNPDVINTNVGLNYISDFTYEDA